MRIDAGSHRGVKLATPEGHDTRPTADRARQAVFNIITHTYDAIREAKVLDVFAGSGAMGLEALSRGAERASFIESDRSAAEAIKKNIAACREQARAQLFINDALKPPRVSLNWGPASLIFLDPPYQKDLVVPALDALREAGWIAPEALLVAEMHRKDAFTAPEGFEVLDDREYGKARMVLLRHH
ncbi:16S rRNA (guanine(966)-N(2))-methyltransferase RsmD [Dongia sedimenti]|uniref:16S rRNA (Guanine(966)-N(2))-methyltransferase RsmD n=1 Tax=Dongia sedimenti TaxID=3064282 RepID=A0ABU0YIZ8_9PROT|nr:16S rRNA (guanine(966)-N(2))-methyltransferase RsmD [Rhodospirillaceae bacterium R-7]